MKAPTKSSSARPRTDFLGRLSATRDGGFSLVTVAALGAVAMMWLFAMSAAVVPMYQRASEGRYFTVVRSSAEAGLDYAVAMLNQSIQAGVPSPIDDGSPDGSPVVSVVPTSALGNSGAQVTVAVNNLTPVATSSIYDPQWDPSKTGAANYWRVITATSTYAGLQKSIRVILKPEPGNQVAVPTRVPYFQFAMFGKSLVSVSGNANTDSYNSANGPYGGTNVNPFGGDVGSNQKAILGDNANIGGDLRVDSVPTGSTTAVVAQASAGAIVKDQLVINGISTGFTATPGPTPMPGDTVLAEGQGLPLRTGDWLTPIDSSQSNPQLATPPAMGIPPDSQVVTGNIQWTGSSGLVGQPASGQVADLGSLSVAGSKTITIRPGDYKISSLSVSGNAQIVVAPNQNGSYGPVRFFVEGISPGSNVIQVAGNGITNQSTIPSNLQFWYNGTKNIQLAGNGNLQTVVYAPNSSIQVTGNGTYFGALLGQQVIDSGNGAVHFDDALGSTTQGGLTYGANQLQAAPSALKTRSWQEL